MYSHSYDIMQMKRGSQNTCTKCTKIQGMAVLVYGVLLQRSTLHWESMSKTDSVAVGSGTDNVRDAN